MSVTDLISTERLETGFTPAPFVTRGTFKTALEDGVYNWNFSSEQYATSEQLLQRDRDFKNLEGQPVTVAHKVAPINQPMPNLYRWQQDNVDSHILKRRSEGAAGWDKIMTRPEAEAAGRERAKEARAKADFAYGNTEEGFFNRWVPSFVGGMGASFADPLNIAGMFIGAGEAKTVLTGIFRQAAVNAGVEAAAQPQIADWQKKLGQEYGWQDAITQVGMAAALGAVVEGGVRVVKPVAGFAGKQASQIWEGIAQSPGIEAAGRRAAQFMERFSFFKERNPVVAPDDMQTSAHMASIRDTAEIMENGRPAYDANIQVRTEDIEASLARKAEDADYNFKKSEAERMGYDMQPRQMEDLEAEIKAVRAANNAAIVEQIGYLRDPESIPKPEGRQSLLSYLISKGGLRDSDGILRAMDAVKARPGLVNNRTLAPSVFSKRRGGLTAEKAMEAAIEGGYMTRTSRQDYDAATAPDTRELFELIEKELRGEKVYAQGDLATDQAHMRNLDDFENRLSELGIDPKKMTDDEILQRLEESGMIETEGGPDLPAWADDLTDAEQAYIMDHGVEYEPRPLNDVMKELEETAGLDRGAVLQRELDDLVKEQGDLVVQMDDGRAISLKDLIEENKRNESWLAEISSCAFGKVAE